MVTLINGLGIYENIFSKEPINSETQSFSNFSIDFKQIAKRNKKFILGGKIDKGVTYKDLDKKSFPCWRPNAIYGNRANGISTDRVIMGSGLFFFDIDFKSEINLDNNYREEIRKLDSLLNGYKEHLILNFKESIVALYKSISISLGLLIAFSIAFLVISLKVIRLNFFLGMFRMSCKCFAIASPSLSGSLAKYTNSAFLDD